MKLLVCGGRHYRNGVHVRATLDAVHAERPITVLVEGGADGADSLARAWAKALRIRFHTYRADWQKLGKAAGPERNARMLRESKPDLVLAFPGGRGTVNMLGLAKQAGVRWLIAADSQSWCEHACPACDRCAEHDTIMAHSS
jgi:hypothetical protein